MDLQAEVIRTRRDAAFVDVDLLARQFVANVRRMLGSEPVDADVSYRSECACPDLCLRDHENE